VWNKKDLEDKLHIHIDYEKYQKSKARTFKIAIQKTLKITLVKTQFKSLDIEKAI